MFDSEKFRDFVVDKYFTLFRKYEKMEEVKHFIQRWLDVVSSYVHSERFIALDPQYPILDRLKPNAKGVIIVAFPNTVVRYPSNVSIYPYYPFRIQREYSDEVSKLGLEFLHYYLDITGIRMVCIYKMWFQEEGIRLELEEKHPGIQIYGGGSFSSFCYVMRTSS